jgi:hypothetical protein
MGRDRKYGEVTTTEGAYIPSDEPVFMLRARDVCSIDTIAHYLVMSVAVGADREHLDRVLDSIDEFRAWKDANVSEMKIPDSVRHGGMADA